MSAKELKRMEFEHLNGMMYRKQIGEKIELYDRYSEILCIKEKKN